MKNKLINLSITTIVVIILSIFLSFIVSLFSYFNIITIKTNDLIMIFLSFIIFFLYGLIIGYKIKKRGFLNGLLLVLFYLSLTFIIRFTNKDVHLSSWYILLARCSLLILGSIIGVNINHD
jgi:putative membrane protein (TIGR04086 family)